MEDLTVVVSFLAAISALIFTSLSTADILNVQAIACIYAHAGTKRNIKVQG